MSLYQLEVSHYMPAHLVHLDIYELDQKRFVFIQTSRKGLIIQHI